MGELMGPGDKLTLEDFAAITAPASEEDYETMPWGEVGSRAVRNFPSAFYKAGEGLVQAVANPIDAAYAMGDVGYGLGSMAYGALGGQQDPIKKQENEALARTMIEPYSALLEGRTGPFKKELAENPVGPLSLALPAAGGALVKTGQAIGTAGKIGSGVSKLGRGIEVASSAVDPARAILESSRAVKNFGPRAATAVQSLVTGTPDVVFEKAFDAAAARGADAEAIRKGFNQFYNGHGDVVGLSQDIENAVNAIRDKNSREWIATRGQITGASTAPIDYSNIGSALNDAWKNYGGHPRSKTSAFPSERAALMDAHKLIREYSRYSPGTGKNTLEGLDELKRALWARSQNATGGAQQAYKKIHAAVRQTLEDTSPEYAKLMDEYQAFLDEMQTIRRAVGAGQTVDANTQLARAMKAFKTPGGASMLERVASVDATIPYKVAGAALNQSPTGLRQVIAGSATAGPAIANALSSGDPIQVAKVVPMFIVGAAATSPRVMGKVSYGAGRVAAGANAVGDLPLGPVNLRDVVSGAASVAYPAALTAEQISMAQDKMPAQDIPLSFSDGTVLDISEPEMAFGGRIARKSGGRVKNNPIGAEVKRVRALLSQKTANMLSLPDDAIATALHIAKRT